MTTQYREIVFLQSDDYEEFERETEDGGAFEYLLQWDYGQGEWSDTCPYGTSDLIIGHNNFEISQNYRYGYAGLCEVREVS